MLQKKQQSIFLITFLSITQFENNFLLSPNSETITKFFMNEGENMFCESNKK